MKKLVFLIAIFCVLKANAQNYHISFAGTGASTTVNTVKVENLNIGTSVTLYGSDVLRLTTATRVNSIEDNQSSVLKIYPNPMIDDATLDIYPPVAGDALITVCEMTGKPVAQIQSCLDNGRQEFRFSGLNNGFYLIIVKGDGYQLSGKLLSIGKSNGTISIKKVSNNIQLVDDKKLTMNQKGVQSTIDMAYNTGDRLKFTGISGIYSLVKMDIPTADKTITFNFISCTDGDNNVYSKVVEIDKQIWLAENLKTTKYRNGDLIGTTVPATKDISSESTPKYQWAYDGNESNVATYGRLYTWYALSDSRNVCPTGWHVFTDPECVILVNTLMYYDYDYGKFAFDVGKSLAATSGWTENSTPGNIGNDQSSNNATGFTALPGGTRWDTGEFGYIGCNCYFWEATESTSYKAIYSYMFCGYGGFGREAVGKSDGKSVRCLKDN
jgi:uncharacterized protein (TIGR02145 family)